MHGQLPKALQQCLTTANMPWLTFSSCLEPRLQVDCSSRTAGSAATTSSSTAWAM